MRREHPSSGEHTITVKGRAAVVLLVVIMAAAVLNAVVSRETLPSGGRAAIERGLALQFGLWRAAGLVADSVTAQGAQALADDLRLLGRVEVRAVRAKGVGYNRVVRVEVSVAGGPPPDGKAVRYLFLDCGPVTECIVLHETSWIRYALGLWFVDPPPAAFPRVTP